MSLTLQKLLSGAAHASRDPTRKEQLRAEVERWSREIQGERWRPHRGDGHVHRQVARQPGKVEGAEAIHAAGPLLQHTGDV